MANEVGYLAANCCKEIPSGTRQICRQQRWRQLCSKLNSSSSSYNYPPALKQTAVSNLCPSTIAGGGRWDGCLMSPPRSPAASSPLHLLEVTVISAQDLHRRRLVRRTRAYAVAWADEAHKLRTGVDRAGGAAPTWNDRFLFRVDAAFLRSDTAAVTVEVRAAAAVGLGADPVLGLTRIVVSTFVRPGGGRQVAALMLRRPRSLRPQGIVNVAVALLDDARAARTVPLYDAPDSPDAFAVKDLAVKKRPPASLCRIAEEADADEEQSNLAFVDHSGRLQDPRVEQRKLEMKLEKWKADLSPGPKEGRRGGARRWGRSSCFRGSGEWDR